MVQRVDFEQNLKIICPAMVLKGATGATYFQKCTGSNKRTIPNNGTVYCIGTGDYENVI